MKKRILSLALCLSLCASNLPAVSVHASDGNSSTTSASTKTSKKKRYIIMFKDKPVSATVKKYNKKAISLEKEAFKIQNKSIKKIENITHTKIRNRYTFLVNSCSINATSSQIKEIEKLDTVKKCYEAHTYKSTMQDAVNMCDLQEAWNDYNLPASGEGTIISIIDSGIDYNHKNLYLDASKTKTKFTRAEMESKIKEIGRGYYLNSKIPFSYDYYDRCPGRTEHINIHGTHVAGIAAAQPRPNEEGIKGVAFNAQLLSMQVLSRDANNAYTDDIVMAIEDSVKLGADVINMSLGHRSGFTDYDNIERDALNAAYNSGCILAIAAGNDDISSSGSNSLTYNNPHGLTDVGLLGNPASYSKPLTVAACENIRSSKYGQIKMCGFTSWGPTPEFELKPEVTAPGGDIYSLELNDNYSEQSGTSLASPYVAGISALVKENVNKKGLKLSNSDLSNYIKYTIMNTATPLMDYTFQDGETPYSVRQQGSGLVNADHAIDNTVIATYKKDAAIELGSIKEGTKSIPISIKLTNYGNTDKKYNLNDCPLYTDAYTSNSYYIEEIKDSYVTFAEYSVTVKAGQSTTVNATVVLSDSVKPNHYIEGFVKLNGSISLNLPLLGFYGDWDELPIFDSPNGSEDCYVDKYGYGYSVYFEGSNENILGLYGNDLDINKSAISLASTSTTNTATPYLTRLRNARDVNVSVVDSNNNLVQNIGNYEYLRKNTFSSKYAASPLAITSNNTYAASWDGKKYNEKTGKYENVKDGQYYFIIKARVSRKSNYQTYKLPLYVDSKMPEADIKYEYDSDNNMLNIDVKASDNFALSPEFTFNAGFEDTINTYKLSYPSSFTLLDNGYRRYSATIKYPMDYLDVLVKDYAGNVNRKLLIGDTFKEKNNTESKDMLRDTLGPTVDLTPSNNNLRNIYYVEKYLGSYNYFGEVKDDTKDVEFTIKLDDQTGVDSTKPITYELKLNKNTGNSNTVFTTNEPHEVEKIDKLNYKITITPEELHNTWAQVKNPTSDHFMAVIKAQDSGGHVTYVNLNLYMPGKDPAKYETEINNQRVIRRVAADSFSVTDSMLNADGTYTLKFDAAGEDIVMAKVNGIRGALSHDLDYHYKNGPSRIVHVSVNIPLKPGKNYYTISLYNDFDDKSLIYNVPNGCIIYNGSGAVFAVDTKTNIKDDVYRCNGDTFNFNLKVISHFKSVEVAVNGNLVYDFYDILEAKNNFFTIPLTYKIKGDYINFVNIKMVDLCGNKSEKTIKVINASLIPNEIKDINDLTIKLASQKTYTGKKVKPTIKIRDGRYKLKKDVDFKLTYKKNKNIGKAKVIITGIGVYKGKVTKYFNIVPGKTRIATVSNYFNGEVTLKAKKLNGGVKYEFFYSTKKKGKYKKLGKSDTPTLVTHKLKNGKKYFFKVRAFKKVKKKKYVGKFSKIKAVKFQSRVSNMKIVK